MNARILLVFSLITIGLLGRPIPVAAQDTGAGGEQVREFDEHILIRNDGTVRIDEHIGYDFGSFSRHGIYRDIPVTKTNDAGKTFVLGFSGISVKDQGGVPYPVQKNNLGDVLRLRIGDANKTVSGQVSYDIGYDVSGALTYFPGHDELYWNVTGNGWEVPIGSVQATVDLPAAVAANDLHAECFTGLKGSADHACTATVTGDRSVRVSTTGPLSVSEGLTVVIGFPKGMVAVLEPKEQVPFFDTMWGSVVLILMAVASLGWYVVAPVMVVRAWFVGGRDPKPEMGEVKAWFSPPVTKSHRLLSPAETGTLIDERADLRDIYASIVDLARRGYLKIIETKKNTFDFEKQKEWDGDGSVLPFERILLDGLFNTKSRVSISTLDVSKTLESVKTTLYESLTQQGFFPSNPNITRGRYIALAVVSLVIFNPILFLVALAFGLNMPRKTLYGSSQAAVARSLKRFLVSQDNKLAFQAKYQMMFETLLPFAIAFGVEEIWAKRFAGLGVANPEWYESATGARFSSVAFAHSIGRGMSISFATSIAAHSSTGHSSGFSGGFSGGGGGGGGGGSW